MTNSNTAAPGVGQPAIDFALYLASYGCRILPLPPRKKAPTLRDWPKKATTDPDQIRRWFGEEPGGNYGIATAGLVVVDIDPRHDGDTWLKENEYRLPETWRFMSGSGGYHLLFRAPEGHNIGNHVGIAPGVDIRGSGGQIVGPGSIHPGGGQYRIEAGPNDAALAEAPAWLLDLINQPKSNGQAGAARNLNSGPIKESERNHTLTRICGHLHKALPEPKVREELDRINKKRCKPPLPSHEVERIIKSIGSREARKQQNSAPGPSDDDNSPGALIEELNKSHFLVREGGRAVIYSPRFDPGLRRTYIDAISKADFSTMYMNRFVPGKKSPIPLGQYWLKNPERRQYLGGVVCDPSGKHIGPDQYNLWQGFAVEPTRGNCQLILHHIHEVICAGDDDLFSYVLSWLAALFKHPERPAEVAIVLRGGKGVGKGTLGHCIKKAFGQHGVYVSNSKHLVGHFNNHLRDAIFVFADEAFFAGDRQHEGTLKALVTEPTITIEAKGRDVIEVPNMLHILMATNDQWAVPTSCDERRFLVLDVSSARRGDHEYFADMNREMEDGGLAALIHYLQEYDLSGFNIRDVPNTAALTDTKLRSMRRAEAWLRDALEAGQICDQKWGDQPLVIEKYEVFEDYRQRAPGYRDQSPSLNLFCKDLYPIGGGQIVHTRRPRDKTSGRRNCLSFTPLRSARTAFDEHVKGLVDWDDEGED